MQTAEYNHEDFSASKQDEADKTLLVKFYLKSVEDKAASIQEGRPIFREREYVDIKVPGQRDGVARPASPADKARFPRHYAAFQNRMEAPSDGTPLTEWPAITRSVADQMSFENIKTVEQLANVNDSNMSSMPGLQTLKQKAKDWLLATKDDAILSQLRNELDEREAKIAEQDELITSLTARLDKLEED